MNNDPQLPHHSNRHLRTLQPRPVDLLDLHLHQPNPLPGLRRLWDRKTRTSVKTSLSDESRRSLPVALVGALSPPQQQRRASVYALWK